jgi:hypothetical protein
MTVITDVEVEASAIHAPGTDIAAYQPMALEEYRPRIIMAADEAAALDKSLRDMMRAVLREDVDFGVIPGTGSKPTLLKPGAEKLLQWFGFGHSTEKVEIERDADGNRLGVTYRCVITKAMQDGRNVIVATCEGYAGYDEDRFFTTAEQAEAKERAMADRYERQPNPAKFAEYRAPWNSVIKMSQKRALVGAALQATSASTLFTQDLEDMRADAVTSPFTEAAEARINALTPETRNALVRWYRGQRWPAPVKWSPGQWCEALQVAGAFAFAAQQQPEPPPAAAQAPAETPASSAEAGDTWLDKALAEAGELPDAEACKKLWRESAAKVHAGEITKDDAKRVQDLLRARIADLGAEAARKAALDDDDPWAVKVEALASAVEADWAVTEVLGHLRHEQIDQARADRLITAIRARFPSASAEPVAA